jgi:hypothetical protein
VPCYRSRIGCTSATASLPSAVSRRLHTIPSRRNFLSSAENDGRVDGLHLNSPKLAKPGAQSVAALNIGLACADPLPVIIRYALHWIELTCSY